MEFKIKNFTIEKFNNDVNNSGNLASKYSNWADYRSIVNEFTAKNFNSKRESVFVFGAGECNDIDIVFLTSQFNHVVLSDIDTKSINEGVKRQKVSEENLNKIRIVKAEYTSLSGQAFFENLAEMTSKKEKHEKVIEYIEKTIANINLKGILQDEKGRHDTVLVLPTYTQLAYTQIETLLRILYQYGIYPIDELNKILTAMHYQMPNILKNYNNLILALLKDGGKVIVLSDVLEMTDLKTVKEVSAGLDDTEHIEGILKDSGSEFGILGIEDLKSKIKNAASEYAIWPFDEQKQFLVELAAGTKKQDDCI